MAFSGNLYGFSSIFVPYFAAISLVDYDIKFYDLLEKEFITSKLNKLVLKKNANVALRKPIYETSTKEELAYVEEENRAYKELVKECRR